MANIELNCERCGKVIIRRTDKVRKHVYCSRECAKGPREQIAANCIVCGVFVQRCKSQICEVVCCSKACSKAYTSKRMSVLNDELNPERMTIETRTKLRAVKLGSGEGKSYEKTFGRHTHRVVAESKMGRSLIPGEVVHHVDENIRNNAPDNLQVFPSQADHALHHADLKKML